MPLRNDHSRYTGSLRSSDDCTEIVRIFDAVEHNNTGNLRIEDSLQRRIGCFAYHCNDSLMHDPAGNLIEHGAFFFTYRDTARACEIENLLEPWQTGVA